MINVRLFVGLFACSFVDSRHGGSIEQQCAAIRISKLKCRFCSNQAGRNIMQLRHIAMRILLFIVKLPRVGQGGFSDRARIFPLESLQMHQSSRAFNWIFSTVSLQISARIMKIDREWKKLQALKVDQLIPEKKCPWSRTPFYFTHRLEQFFSVEYIYRNYFLVHKENRSEKPS